MQPSSVSLEAKVFFNKLAAARRQLDAAIRMVLADEDELAIHTVAAASYKILRDVKKKRDQEALEDQLGYGIFTVASDYASGKLEELPDWVRNDPDTKSFFEGLVESIRSSEAQSVDDALRIEIDQHAVKKFWGTFDLPANFLKHANTDPQASKSLDEFDNLTLILMACSAYIDLMKVPTTEMVVFHVFRATKTGEKQGMRQPYQGWADRLEALEPEKQREYWSELSLNLSRNRKA